MRPIIDESAFSNPTTIPQRLDEPYRLGGSVGRMFRSTSTSGNAMKPLLKQSPQSAVVLAGLAILSACGGGGDASPTPAQTPVVTVTSATAATPKYGQALILTVNGTNLDQGLSVASTACPGAALVNAAPLLSTGTTAYYRCTVAAVGAGQFLVTRNADGATLIATPFTVAMPQVTMTLSNGGAVNGSIVITLAPDRAPITVNNFLGYVNTGFYDNTVIHRVSQNFIVQGGGYAAPVDISTTTAKPTNAAIPLEANVGLGNAQWSIAMARTSAPNTATSQFYINLVDNSGILDASPTRAGFAVFGSVSAGTDTVAGIVAAPCTSLPLFAAPGSTECTPTPNVVVVSAVQSR
jgi:peptidyl-prolyl cis-trans isomerase A (cyclophilin A)